MAPAILKANKDLENFTGGHKTICVVADPVYERVSAMIDDKRIKILKQNQLKTALAAIDGAIACSGTITSQLAMAGVPTVVLYQVSPLTYLAGRALFEPDYFSMVNIAGEKELMPEFIQGDIHTSKPAQALWDILSKPENVKSDQRPWLLRLN